MPRETIQSVKAECQQIVKNLHAKIDKANKDYEQFAQQYLDLLNEPTSLHILAEKRGRMLISLVTSGAIAPEKLEAIAKVAEASYAVADLGIDQLRLTRPTLTDNS